jgi:tRNA (guanine26-N2/guanine27-N2)-dimethyltransferase
MNHPHTVLIKEGTSQVFVFQTKNSQKGPGVKQKEPFYNPSMEVNRDLSILVNQWFINQGTTSIQILDGLAASGIRGIRFARELEGSFTVTINDRNQQAFSLIKKNCIYHHLDSVVTTNKDLNVILSEKKFHSIDIDPFGSPVYFLDAALRSVYHNGIIACTATDTATLSGVYPTVCKRRYASVPFHTFLMHEIGLRILLGFICREAAKYDKGIVPLLCYASDHYFRCYVQVKQGKKYANKAMEFFSLIPQDSLEFPKNSNPLGPLWLGRLADKSMVQQVRTLAFLKEIHSKHVVWKLLALLEEEADAPPFFYSTNSLSSYLHRPAPKMQVLFEKLRKKGYLAARTHFHPTGFKTNAPFDEVIAMFEE